MAGKGKGWVEEAAPHKEIPSDQKPVLLFEHSRFSLFLHEGSSLEETPLKLQVRVRTSLSREPARRGLAEQADRLSQEAAEPGASGDVPEEVLSVGGPSYCLRHEGPDIFLEFGKEVSADRLGNRNGLSRHAGCCYGFGGDEGHCPAAAKALAPQQLQFSPDPRRQACQAAVSLPKTPESLPLMAPPDTPEKPLSRLPARPWPKALSNLPKHVALCNGESPDKEEEVPNSRLGCGRGRRGREFDGGGGGGKGKGVGAKVAGEHFQEDRDKKAANSRVQEGVGVQEEDAAEVAKVKRLAQEDLAGKELLRQAQAAILARRLQFPLDPSEGHQARLERLRKEDPWVAAGPLVAVAGPSVELLHLSSSKVEWRIWGIAAKMAHYPKGSRIFSPEFSTFQISGLGLVFYPNGNSSAKTGFCSLGLKAPHGTHLRYKLYIGVTERFTDLRHNVTESWGFVDMCKVEDEVQPEDDLLRLGVEIIDDIDANETLKNASPMKVEWVIGSMQNKLAHYRKDVAVYSDEFSVGGVDKLRLKFYPAGKKEADPGWCSLYLEAPKGSELRCRLSVGRKSMSFDRLEKFGEDSIWGFLTLCKLREELEQDGDTLRITLEVLETRRLDGRLSDSEDAYLKTLSVDKRTHLLGELDRIEKMRNSEGAVPSRFRILQLELPDHAKAVALGKLDSMNSDKLSGETSKLKKWIEGLLSIPFGNLRKPMVSIGEGKVKVQQYLEKAHSALDAAVFGHEEPKNKIVQILCQWIANPTSMSLVLGIQGPPGNGKTTLARQGIAEALGRPFVQVSLGGATDASVLEGHSYTYVGSTWGRIAGLIMEAKCMNPVIFFDELDKVSDTPRGEEIIGVLTHLTDHSQNKTFTDRYFEGIPLDLSRALFVFSFNDESRLNHVLKDRLTVIHTEGFDQSAKLKISREYLMPELLANVGMKAGDVDIGREELTYLCNRCGVSTEEGGVRGIKQALEGVILRLNEIRMTQQDFADVEGKADDGETKADDGAQMKADAELKADNAQKVSNPQKADSGNREDEGKKEAEQSVATRQRTDSTKSEDRARKAKKLRVHLPLFLTKDLIEQLVTQKDVKNGASPMMYI